MTSWSRRTPPECGTSCPKERPRPSSRGPSWRSHRRIPTSALAQRRRGPRRPRSRSFRPQNRLRRQERPRRGAPTDFLATCSTTTTLPMKLATMGQRASFRRAPRSPASFTDASEIRRPALQSVSARPGGAAAFSRSSAGPRPAPPDQGRAGDRAKNAAE